MKFKQTDYLGTKQILKFPDHYVAMSVSVSDVGIVADEYGEKIIPAGTIVGGNGVILNPTNLVSDVNIGFVKAALTTAFATANSNLTFSAREEGTAGNAVKVALVAQDLADQVLSVAVAGTTITVNLATDENKAIITTANDVIAIITENDIARDLVSVENIKNSDGSGIVSTIAATALSGGANGTAGTAEGVLMNDVDVTYGPANGAMIIHGFIDITKMPYVPTATHIAALKNITFLG